MQLYQPHGYGQPLAVNREGSNVGGRVVQLDLSSPSPHQPRQHLTATQLPLRELLSSDGVRILALVEPLDEGGGPDIATADVEGPADERAILVCVQHDRRLGDLGDALLSDLERCCAVN